MKRARRSAVTEQTRAYALRADVVASQLRSEIARVPARPHGAPALVVLMGLPGVGKSHCARLLSERLGAAHVASDELRVRLFVAASYADEENRAVFAAAAELVRALLAEGHRVVLDATNQRARNREGFVAAAAAARAPVVFVRISAPDTEIRTRLIARRVARAAHDHSEADETIYERMRDSFEPPAAGFIEITNGPNVARDLERVVRAVEGA